MRLTTGFKYDLPFELWTGVLVPSAGGTNVLTYQKAGDRFGMIVQMGGGLNLITEEALPLNSQIRNLEDSKGQPIFVESGIGYPMYVTTSDPQFDPFMRIIGWKHRLARTLPRDVIAALDALIEA